MTVVPDRGHGVVEERTRRFMGAAEALQVDHWTAQVVTALHAASVRPILLKGPAVAEWLYAEDPGGRSYADIDLLVAPHEMGEAKAVLGALGFVPPAVQPLLRGDAAAHGGPWTRRGDSATVDLHRTIHGCELAPEALVWRVLAAGTSTMAVAGADVTVLGFPARTLHAVLHLEPKCGPGSKPWVDLARALELVDDGTWRAALDLARALGVEAEMGVKLRRLDAGAALADRLGVVDGPCPRLAQFTGPGDQRIVGRLGALLGWRAKIGFLGTKLLPPPEFLRQKDPTLADRGRAALLLAYGRRLGRGAAMTPQLLVRWVRAGQERRRKDVHLAEDRSLGARPRPAAAPAPPEGHARWARHE